MSKPDCDALILLVGSNPLPNYFAACLLRPRTAVLVYTRRSERVKNSLATVLRTLDGMVVDDLFVHAPMDPQLVHQDMQRLHVTRDTHLNYTGGTKVMATQARLVFAEKNGLPSRASYLSDDGHELRFDGMANGLRLADAEISLSFDRLLDLHGFTRDPDPSSPLPAIEEAEPLVRALLEDPKHQEGSGRALEAWVRKCIADVDGECEISGDVYIRVPGKRRSFQVDAVVIRRHRVYYVSSTVTGKTGRDTTLEVCKGKLFEAIVRARQISGDMVRVGLVSLLHGTVGDDQEQRQRSPTVSEPRVDAVQADIDSLWDAPTKAKVFGLDDLREWAGICGPPRLNTLAEWLDS